MNVNIGSLLASLEARDVLSDDERTALTSAPWRVRTFDAEEEMVAQGSRPVECCLLVEGLTGRTIMFEDGRRQITALQIAGDFVDLHSLLLKVMDHNVVALTPVKAAFLAHSYIEMLTNTQPHLWRVLSTLMAVDGAIQRNWIAGLGRRSADSQLAHLICEIHERMRIVGLVTDNSFAFRLTQAVLADVQGLSVVHVNRMLQALRTKGLISWVKDVVTIRDWASLAGFAEFDPTYLNDMQIPR